MVQIDKSDTLGRWALVRARQFVITHKSIFEKAIIAFASIMPDYTRDNCVETNSLILFDIRDKFFQYYTNDSKMRLFKAAWKIAIFENEHDPHYRDVIFGWILEELVEAVMDGRWQSRLAGHPSGHWEEPRTPQGAFGKYRGRRFAELITRREP